MILGFSVSCLRVCVFLFWLPKRFAQGSNDGNLGGTVGLANYFINLKIVISVL